MTMIAPSASVQLAATPYRADIDGLRAVAILAVLFYHAFPDVVPGGFIGVDVFFVISGYLIGGVIFQDLARGRFSLGNFYIRRVRRLFPALLLVLATSLVAGWGLLLSYELESLGRHVRDGLLFMLNLTLRRETGGYFATAADAKPLLHLWSLAVEEQFYIFWPVLMLALARWRGRRGLVVTVLGLLLAVSFGWNVVRVMNNPVATFFLPQTRVWELLLGVLLAHAEAGAPGRLTDLVRRLNGGMPANTRAGLGAGLILTALLLLGPDARFPGWWALLPTIGTMLLLSAGPGTWLSRWLLATPVAVFLGLVSYPLYLWHWPLLSFARITNGEEPTVWVRLGLMALAFGLAVATWKLVEMPIRTGRLRASTGALTGLVGAALGLGVLGQLALQGALTPLSDQDPRVRALAAAAGAWDFPGADMQRVRLADDGMAARTLWRKQGAMSGTVLFLGDSNIEHYGPRLRAVIDDAPAAHPSIAFLTGGSCLPIAGIHQPKQAHCGTLLETAFAQAVALPAHRVVIAGLWSQYFAGTIPVEAGGQSLTTLGGQDAAMVLLGETIRRFRAAGTEVVLVLTIPTGAGLSPKSLIRHEGLGLVATPGGRARADVEQANGSAIDRLAQTAAEAGATLVNPLDFLCADGWCPAVAPDGTPIYKDHQHLQPAFVRAYVTFLDSTLNR